MRATMCFLAMDRATFNYLSGIGSLSLNQLPVPRELRCASWPWIASIISLRCASWPWIAASIISLVILSSDLFHKFPNSFELPSITFTLNIMLSGVEELYTI